MPTNGEIFVIWRYLQRRRFSDAMIWALIAKKYQERQIRESYYMPFEFDIDLITDQQFVEQFRYAFLKRLYKIY